MGGKTSRVSVKVSPAACHAQCFEAVDGPVAPVLVHLPHLVGARLGGGQGCVKGKVSLSEEELAVAVRWPRGALGIRHPQPVGSVLIVHVARALVGGPENIFVGAVRAELANLWAVQQPARYAHVARREKVRQKV